MCEGEKRERNVGTLVKSYFGGLFCIQGVPIICFNRVGYLDLNLVHIIVKNDLILIEV